ncbi:MAG: hypothetical protein ACKV0T_08615 [Planctomycetales bacterium]
MTLAIAKASNAPEPSRRGSIRVRGLWLTGALAVLIVGIGLWYAQSGLRDAQRLAARRHWQEARGRVGDYLRLHPASDAGKMLLAETLARDEQLPAETAIPRAIELLREIPAGSPHAEEARIRAANLELLVLLRPLRAEALLREATVMNPDSLEAWYALWKLLELTGRSQFAETAFWRVYELTPLADRGERMRDWYMSQFFPATANPALDQLMGFSNPAQTHPAGAEFQRLLEYRNAERDAPAAHASLARWFHNDGDHRQALSLLEEGWSLPRAFEDGYFVATLTSVAFELGDFDAVAQYVRQWPEPREGYEYWRWEAIAAEEIDHDYPRALDAYARSLQVWPGPADWRTQFRQANCLAKMGRGQEANELRTAARRVEDWMDREVHRRLREQLRRLDDREALEGVVEFYAALGRAREVAAWREVLDHLAGE